MPSAATRARNPRAARNRDGPTRAASRRITRRGTLRNRCFGQQGLLLREPTAYHEGDVTTRGSSAQPIPFGPFILERRIAVGACTEVFIARPKTGLVPAARFVVKKLLESGSDPSRLDALEQEAALHRAVVHENVVDVYGAGAVGSEPYLAMEYVEGVDLYRLLRRAEAEHRPFPHPLAVFIARRVGLALSAVHSAVDDRGQPLHIVHRDVTPSNVYLSVEGAVKLGDFGIARVASAEGTQPGATLKGKFAYLAPEQVAGEPFDHRADLFALTVMLGELLIGERVFPGSGQLAVLLAIRDVNVDPLMNFKDRLEPALFEVCVRGMSRDPADRFQSGSELADALWPLESGHTDELRNELASWIRWAADSSHLARRLEGKIRDSVQRMRAARRASGQHPAAPGAPEETGGTSQRQQVMAKVRCRDGRVVGDLAFPKLMEMIATGELRGTDEVALAGSEYRCIRDIDSLAKHLLPSTTATTGRLFQPGVPDYQVTLNQTPMLGVLARLRQHFETGAVFVEAERSTVGRRRKEIYLREGRLLHVASTEKAELLGEYLVRRGSISRSQLEVALNLVSRRGGRLGDTLIGMGVVEAMDVFHAIRDQGRDRVAALCGWKRGLVTFYRNTAPGHVEFPLDLDLTSAMMAGVIVASQDDPCSTLPDLTVTLRPGRRHGTLTEARERGTAPISMQLLPGLATKDLTVGEALDQMVERRPARGTRTVSRREACAALVTGKILGWIDF